MNHSKTATLHKKIET